MIDCGLNRFNSNVRLQEKTIFLIAEMFAKTVEVDRFSSFTTIISNVFMSLVWCGMNHDRNLKCLHG